MTRRIPQLASVLLVTAAAVSAVQMEGDFALPFEFQPGTPARADEVNANFQAAADELVRLDVADQLVDARLDDVTQRVDALDWGANRVLVAPSGAAFSSVAAALASVEGASSASPWLVQVAPGVYDETELCVVAPHVHLRGSGAGVTVIRAARSAAAQTADAAVLDLREAGRVSALSIVNQGGVGNYAIGAFSAGTTRAAVLQNVTVRATLDGGLARYALFLVDSDLTVEGCTLETEGDVSATVDAGVGSLGPDGSNSTPLFRRSSIRSGGVGFGMQLVRTSAEILGCDVIGQQFAVSALVSGHVRAQGCRMGATVGWAETTGSAQISTATSMILGPNPSGAPQSFKYANCHAADYDAIADGVGSDVTP